MGFVDVLFALVVGKILDASVDGHLPIAGKAQLALAAAVTVTSWVGYHNSGNRSPYFLWFFNWPLVQFIVDVCLVYVYWLLVVYAEKATPAGAHPVAASAKPEAILLTIAAGLYVLWDLVAWRIRVLPEYAERPREQDVPARRLVSVGLLLATGVVLTWVAAGRHTTGSSAVVTIDVVLAVLVLAYRWAKELVTPPDALRPRRAPTPDAD